MDPNANLEEMLRLAQRMQRRLDQPSRGTWGQDQHAEGQMRVGARLAELVLAMDEWLSKGGFLPKKWAQGR